MEITESINGLHHCIMAIYIYTENIFNLVYMKIYILIILSIAIKIYKKEE